jgi:AbrB family looped-hinge helix DNA binding protein
MELAIISADFEVEIPASIREALGIEPGQRMEIRERDGRIELLSLRPITELGGLLRDMPNDFEREPDRDLP